MSKCEERSARAPDSSHGTLMARTERITVMDDEADIEAVGVKDERGHALLFDLWINGRWVGSRRTIEQCERHLSGLLGCPVGATFGRAW